MLSWLRKKIRTEGTPVFTDIHSHLLPGLDDGVQTFEQAEEIIVRFQNMGYTKLITTPHVMSDAYRNSNETIVNKLNELREWLSNKNNPMIIEAAAEYYLDEVLTKRVDQDDPLLIFGKKYLLFETNFMTEPLNLKEFIFSATTKGYRLVLAHPERYLYLQGNLEKAEDLINRGVLFQVNISSLSGYYSKQAQQAAIRFIDRGWVHLLGSDCHHLQHAQLVADAQGLKYFEKAISLPLLNNSL